MTETKVNNQVLSDWNATAGAGLILNKPQVSGINTGDNRQATEKVLGIVQAATTEEVRAEKDNSKYITPLRLHESPVAIKAEHGASHTVKTDNPHKVTAEQAGADKVGTAEAAVGDHTKEFNHADIAHKNRNDLDAVRGINTGDQTIELTGDVGGSGKGSFKVSIKDKAVTYAKMQDISATDKLLGRVTTGAGDIEEIDCTAAGRVLLKAKTAGEQKKALGIGSMASQEPSNVDITGGSIKGIKALAIKEGGTGQGTKAAALNALSPAKDKGSIIAYDNDEHIGIKVGTNGQVLTADDTQVGGMKWVDPNEKTSIAVVKQADECVSESDGLQNDDELRFSMRKGESWVFELAIVVSGESLKFRMGAVDGLTGSVEYSQQGISMTGFSKDSGLVVLSAEKKTILITGAVKATSDGALNLQWSQNAPAEKATKIHALSSLKAMKA